MKQFRFWLAEKVLRLSWWLSPNNDVMKKMQDYTGVYGVGLTAISPRDIYLEPTKDS